MDIRPQVSQQRYEPRSSALVLWEAYEPVSLFFFSLLDLFPCKISGLKQTANLTPSGTRELCLELKIFRLLGHQKVNTRPEARGQCLKEKPLQPELTISAYSTVQCPSFCHSSALITKWDLWFWRISIFRSRDVLQRWLIHSGYLLLPQGTRDQVPAPTWQLSARASNALFWPPQAPEIYAACMHACQQSM